MLSFYWKSAVEHDSAWCKCVIVYPARDIRLFVIYCVNGKPRSSLLIESTDSIILKDRKNILKMNKEVGMLLPKKRANTSGVGKINNYCEDIYNYTSLRLATPTSY